MLTYKHILLATDFSENTNIIAQKAVDLARKSNAKISAVHVLEHTPIIYGAGEFSVPIDMDFEEQIANHAKSAMQLLGQSFGIVSEDQHIVHGSIKRAIILLASQINVDLIVVGSHRHSSMEFLLGSTANAILHVAKCDVLAARA